MFSILILLGPGENEAKRFLDLLKSIIKNEPMVREKCNLIIVIDNNAFISDWSFIRSSFQSLTILYNPLTKFSKYVCDRQTAGFLFGMNYAITNFDNEYLLKVDTDVICINPFSDILSRYSKENPTIGICGTYLNWPLKGNSRLKDFADWGARIKKVHKKSLVKSMLSAIKYRRIVDITNFYKRRMIFKIAIANGYKYGYHVQGGAMMLTKAFVSEFSKCEIINNPYIFERSYIGDDNIISLISFYLGLKCSDFNNKDQVFGIWFDTPPISYQELLSNKLSLIHRIKCKNINDESTLRNDYKLAIN